MHELYAKHMGGKKDGFVATGVMEIEYETDSFDSGRK